MKADDAKLLEVVKWEYDTLRTEMLSLQSSLHTFASLSISALAVLVAVWASAAASRWLVVPVAVALLSVALLWRYMVLKARDRIALRIVEIERIVNETLGETRDGYGLVWESRRAENRGWLFGLLTGVRAK